MNRKLSSRILSLAILTAMLLSSCQSGGEPSETSETTVSANYDSETSQTPVEEKVDLGGITINVFDQPCEESDIFMFNLEEANGENLNDAIFESNERVKEELNFEFNTVQYIYAGNQNMASEALTTMILADDDDYDFCFGVQFDLAPMVAEEFLLDMSGAQEISFDSPWWYNYYMDEASVYGNNYLLAGDATLGLIRKMSCMYIDAKLYDNYYGDKSELYKTVLDGKWTLDALSELTKGVYDDLNSNSVADKADLYGMITNDVANIDHFTYDAGIRFTERNSDGEPVLIVNNERTVEFAEKMYSILYDNPGTRIFAWNEETNMVKKFNSGEALCYPAFFSHAEQFRDKTDDFLIVPYPKLDESVERYYSLAHDTSTVMVLPITCTKVSEVATVLEAMAKDGHDNVLPVYYENSFKMKYARDSSDDAIKIIDLIHDSVTTDFANIYNYALNDAGLFMRNVLGGSKTAFATLYASKETGMNAKLESLLELMK